MRGLVFVALTGCATQADWNAVESVEAERSLDSGLALEPTDGDACPNDVFKTEPGYCGCGWIDLDLDATLGGDTCVHQEATVSGSAVLGVGATIFPNAIVGNATIGERASVGVRASVADGASIGADSRLGRGASVGLRSVVGANSSLGRAATVAVDVDASPGGLTLGYASSLGDDVEILGTGVILGNLVNVAAGSKIGGGVVLARGVSVGLGASVGAGSIIGPEVQIGADVRMGGDVRVRKDTVIGAESEIGLGARIGRDGVLFPRSVIGENASLRANVTVESGGRVSDSEYIPRGTTVRAIETCAPGAGFDRTWTGDVNSDWSTGGNWSPVGPPGSSQSAFICGFAANQPVLTQTVSVEGLGMSASAVINLGGNTLNMFGDMQASLIEGAGTINVNRAVNIEGTVTNIDITNRVTLSGPLTANNRLSINSSGTLLVTDETLDIKGPFEQTVSQPNRGLMMSGPSAEVRIGGSATFNGSSDMGANNLASGALYFNGSVVAEDSGYGVLRVGGATTYFGSTGSQGLFIPNSSVGENYLSDVVLLEGSNAVAVQGNNPLYIRGDLDVQDGRQFQFLNSAVTVRDNLTIGTGASVFDNVGSLRYGGSLTMTGSSRLDTQRLIAEGEVPRPTGDWRVNRIQIEGDVALDQPWDFTQSSFHIVAPGSVTVAGHSFTLDGQFTQDIGSDPDAGFRMAAGDVVQINGGVAFKGNVDMAPTNFTGGDFGVTNNVNIDGTDAVLVNMQGTRLLMNDPGPGNSSAIFYGGAGRSYFSDVVLGPFFVGATQLDVDAEQVFGNLTVLRAVSPNKDLRITGTLTVAAGGFVGSAAGAITTVEGACIIDPTATLNNNVICP